MMRYLGGRRGVMIRRGGLGGLLLGVVLRMLLRRRSRRQNGVTPL